MHAGQPDSGFLTISSDFEKLTGPSPELQVILEDSDCPFAHEAGVFVQSNNELWITSNQFEDEAGNRKVQITKIDLAVQPARREQIDCEDIHFANGGVNFDGGILFCAQGSTSASSGLYKMSTSAPYQTEAILMSFYGRPFNSVNDVVIHKDGTIWFTDPCYGFEQGYRPKPQLPNQVYRYDPKTSSVRVVADGFGRPNGICFSPDEHTLYITDTDHIHGDGSQDGSRASTIYAFDVATYHDQPFLINRRVFAFSASPIPDGIKCDVHGNIYSGCADGVNVWSGGGVLLGKILVSGGAANFCFERNGEVFILNEHRLWRAQLHESTKGALLKI